MQNNKDEIFPRKMILTGKGQVSVNPDLAIIRLGVQTNAADVTTAQSENARISQNVISALKGIGITELQTVLYQIEKIYDYENGQRIDRGYQVRNLLEIRTNNMAQVGTIIDTAVNNGANIVDSVRFDVRDQEFYYQKALNLAVKNAISKAKSIAVSLGIRMDPVPVLITENTSAPIPYSTTFAKGEVAYTTPIEPGYMQIDASITGEFIY